MNLFAKEFMKSKKIDQAVFNVHRELKIPKGEKIKGGRTDVCAYSDNQRIVIENKVFSGLNGIDDENKTTQLTIYYNWAKQPGQLEPLCFISCPDFRKAEIELEIEDVQIELAIKKALRELQRYWDESSFVTIPFENYNV